ncbi:hypothetical protein CCHR01_02724 [Colletotrichum chrysophilum]|uniref:Uncharacterized protein n=1 Tax=Colletotrichum chrysophilum TaxID=1836956 RepID=A0AAD9AV90_9PEZI|nr:hypothetical protein CCHR01_02724 [Colletotrichum chrysophilum]
MERVISSSSHLLYHTICITIRSSRSRPSLPKFPTILTILSPGDAYFGDYTQFNDSNAAPVIFTPQTDDEETWIGAPNTTAVTTTPTWSNLTFTIPSSDSDVHNVAFLESNSSSTGRQTSGFAFYGNFVLVEADDGSYESLWYATATETDGIYNLRWNETGDDTDDKIILNLRRTAPSN